MDITITPAKLHGTVPPVPSKSDLHRALICAALADAPTEILLPSPSPVSEDIRATAACLKALGAGIEGDFGNSKDPETGRIRVTPVRAVPKRVVLECGESGSTARFMIPVAAALCKEAHFTGSGRLPERPLSPLTAELEKHGYACSSDHLPLTMTRTEKAGASVPGIFPENPVPGIFPGNPVPDSIPEYSLPGSISSQFITGLLLAAPLTGGVRIRLSTPLSSASYVDMTIDTMERFGVTVNRTADGFEVLPASYRSPGTYRTDGGWSSAAFFIAADVLSSDPASYDRSAADTLPDPEHAVFVTDLRRDSLQGDRVIAEIADDFRKRRTEGDPPEMTIDADSIPDLVPVIAVMAALTPGRTRIVNASRLRLKESDRLRTTAEMLSSLGAEITEQDSGLLISGKESLAGGTVSGCGDHRIVMSAAIASIGCRSEVTILGAEAVAKSYPSFWEAFAALGGRIKGENYVN